ncbi:hypothetical protein ABOM_002382 [Aspergillus bombycis]|uniref:Uncharacterized protein n=1 Tax=Aspergillus bombycis TaxID=109264 RepID=A0A1F8ABJ5_9EURO|nr:hypothetical protein ABOM_002382 [Aspergillus bombycis]OGM49090.1 hypothetical protein ABOM_002382 [Aspergillus bombycis]
MSTTDESAMRAEPGLQKCPFPNPKFQQLQDDRFRFTPVKVVKPAPRIWDRQPSTPFLARPKSRKVWKRFRSSFNSMKALQRLISAQSAPDDHDDLYTEINASRNEDYMRGIKRRCLVHDSEEQVEITVSRGRSFLETKWESEASGKRRKFPAYRGLVDSSEPIVADSQALRASDNGDSETSYQNAPDAATSGDENLPDTAENNESMDGSPDTPTRLAAPAAYPRTLHGLESGMDGTTADIKGPDDLSLPQADLPGFSSLEAGPPENIEEQENDAVLDATMTDDLQSGLCESQTPATVSPESVQQIDATEPPPAAPVQNLTAEQESTLVRSALRSSLDGEDAQLLNNFLSKAKAKREAKAAAAAMVTQDTEEKADPEYVEIPEIPTPQGRRVLEDLDANSPSPQKAQLSPSKAPGKDIDENEDQRPCSPRRSTRTRSVKPPPRMTTTTTAARNTLTLRRAKGTEFIFLKKTEAQELALATRRNTRQNKGDAMLPKYTLQTLAQQTSDSDATSDDDKSARDSGRRRASAKRVSWNDERLVEYEGESGEGSSDDAAGRGGKSKNSEKRKAASSRTTRSQGPSKTGGDTVPAAATTAATTATPRPRRVRRLGTPKPTAAVDASASPSTSMSPPETRKKLIPKSPRTALAGSSVSKKVSRVSTRSDTRASLDSSSLKSSSLFKAHAGSTPMPRRVRS